MKRPSSNHGIVINAKRLRAIEGYDRWVDHQLGAGLNVVGICVAVGVAAMVAISFSLFYRAGSDARPTPIAAAGVGRDAKVTRITLRFPGLTLESAGTTTRRIAARLKRAAIDGRVVVIEECPRTAEAPAGVLVSVDLRCDPHDVSRASSLIATRGAVSLAIVANREEVRDGVSTTFDLAAFASRHDRAQPLYRSDTDVTRPPTRDATARFRYLPRHDVSVRIYWPGSGAPANAGTRPGVAVHAAPEGRLTHEDIARLALQPTGDDARLRVGLRPASRAKLAAWRRAFRGRAIALVIDDAVFSTAIVPGDPHAGLVFDLGRARDFRFVVSAFEAGAYAVTPALVSHRVIERD